MSERVLLLVGTRKGGFILESDAERRDWRIRGPLCEGWPIHDMTHDPSSGALYAAGGNEWYGPAVWRSDDLGETWSHSSEGIAYGDEGPKIRKLWNVTPAHGSLYAGADPAGLFRSDGGGATWRHVGGLRDHPTRPEWEGGAGGLCLHSIVPHPTDPQRLWVAISAVGTMHTTDGGATWTLQNNGVRACYRPDPYPEFGQCVHKLAMAPGDPALLYEQTHCGVYRSSDGGASWQEITAGLPSQFGFPMVVHPRDPRTIWVVPLNGDQEGRYMPDGRAAVWRSRDGGDSWSDLRAGLPQENAYLGVLREAMAVDRLDPAGVYLGTGTGQLFASPDEGEHWSLVADFLPPIWSVDVAVVGR